MTADFHALDRFHAIGHVGNLGLPAELASSLIDALNKLHHAGPVHVTLQTDGVDGGDPFHVRPFHFVTP